MEPEEEVSVAYSEVLGWLGGLDLRNEQCLRRLFEERCARRVHLLNVWSHTETQITVTHRLPELMQRQTDLRAHQLELRVWRVVEAGRVVAGD